MGSHNCCPLFSETVIIIGAVELFLHDHMAVFSAVGVWKMFIKEGATGVS